MTERHVVVVKIGSSSLVDEHGRLDGAFLDRFAAQIAALAKAGKRPVLVTSGAVASGIGILGLKQRPPGISERQALAAIGQASLAHRWQAALLARGLVAAQVLLTNDDFTERSRYLNLTAAFRALFAYGAVPVINENDTVAVDELTVGDNDRLSAMVATQLGAELLVLLTDIDGVYDADPRGNPDATLIRDMDGVSPALLKAAGAAGGLGRGGMRSKLEAARLAGGAGIPTVIAPARAPDVLTRILAREAVGTRVAPRGKATDGRRRWLAMARTVHGRLTLDTGAAEAVARDGRSLLPAGIVAVSGRFERGDTVAIVDPHGDEIARGLAELSSVELERVAGKKLDAAARELGYALPKTAIHRDNMLVLVRR
ncbi:MAG TPA: glutamate 5-kinase [Planctomycetota bacterium]|nr:glutamate 5-kinase [Planctomycetota bacterium]